MMAITPEILAAGAGVLVSLFLEFFPKFKLWYDQLKNSYQALIAVAAAIVFGFVIFGFNCLGWWVGKIPTIACSQSGVQELLWMIFLVFSGSQVTYLGVRNIGKGK